jgi:hypothetical protein
MVYFAFDLEPISMFAERECEHAPSAHNYLADSGRSNVEMLAVSSSINARNRMFERRGIHEVVVDRPG